LVGKAYEEGMPVSQMQIAKKLGLSQRAVSAAIRNDGRVSKATRERVLKVAAEMGYRPNAAAKVMKRGHFKAVGLVASTDIRRSLYWDYLHGIHLACRTHDLHLTVGEVEDENLTDPRQVPRLLREWMVDGLINSYMMGFPKVLQDILDGARIPNIWMNARQDHDCVFPDELQGFTLATRYLIEQGHRRIMYVGPNPDPDRHYSAVDRWRAYSDAMKAAGLPTLRRYPDDEIYYLSDNNRNYLNEVFRILQSCLKEKSRPTALLLSEDIYPVAHHAATCLGLDIPADLSILVCNSEPTVLLGGDITTLLRDTHQVGQTAVDLVMKKIKAPGSPLDPVAIPYTLVAQDASVAPPTS